MTPRETLHACCHYCTQNRSDDAVRDCGGDLVMATGKPCPFYQHRLSTGRVSVRTLRRLCIEECMGGIPSLVVDCNDRECVLFPYRMGKSPAHAGMKVSPRSIEALRCHHRRGDKSGNLGQFSTNAP